MPRGRVRLFVRLPQWATLGGNVGGEGATVRLPGAHDFPGIVLGMGARNRFAVTVCSEVPCCFPEGASASSSVSPLPAAARAMRRLAARWARVAPRDHSMLRGWVRLFVRVPQLRFGYAKLGGNIGGGGRHGSLARSS